MGLDVYLRFALALVLVIALIGALAWIVRRMGWGSRFVAPAGKRRLGILEVLPLDGKRRLVLLRRDEAEHLILLGADRDLLIESAIGRTRPDFASLVEQSRS
ncbi:MAG TPA: flagellar biosynthetic protein FliO [Stellaceae bacterium]|nr:flagellar biosynthetic protein FliO [Stellaceae bacterium]